jgi:hypothetical protein
MHEQRPVLTAKNRVFDVEGDGMLTLRSIFPSGKATDHEFVLFSTSARFGRVNKIEDVEAALNQQKPGQTQADFGLVFVAINSSTQNMVSGICYPGDQADIEYLKSLRESSHEQLTMVGI